MAWPQSPAAQPASPVTLTALIADDEELPRQQLVAGLKRVWPELQLVEAANGVDAWDAFLEHEPALCFLDLRMPGMTGIEVAQRIGARAHIVFVTAFGDHALAALDAGAVDHLLKPVDEPRLRQMVSRVKARLAQPDAAPPALQGLLDRLAGQTRKPAPLESIEAGFGRDLRLVRLDDVIYFEADARYTRVVVAAGDLLLRTPLKELVAQLDPRQFWQVHRSTIVNRCHVAGAERVDDATMFVTLRTRPDKLPVSRHFQHLFDAS